MDGDRIADVLVLIVGFRNAADIEDCLAALSSAAADPTFDIFICENGGAPAYLELVQALLSPTGPCRIAGRPSSIDVRATRFTDVQRLVLRTNSSQVWVGCANDNLGYAGGINAWLQLLETVPGWKGVWVLNPDTKPSPNALAALVESAETSGKGMTGGTIVDTDRPGEIRCRGGLHWKLLTARTAAVGLGDALDEPADISAVEALMDSPSGASMYVTRECIEKIGRMDESYFLFFEDLDWGLRAKRTCGLAYAPASLVEHKRGTTTGTANKLAAIPRLTLYLEHRNAIRFVRKHFPWTLPLRIFYSFLYAIKLLINGAPKASIVILQGVLAGLRGEFGRPERYSELTVKDRS